MGRGGTQEADSVREPAHPGSEEKLRHFIESVVEQANAATEPPDDETDADEQVASNGDEAGPDELMTQRFRAFSSQAIDGEPGVAQ
jgi:hypothetical protein